MPEPNFKILCVDDDSETIGILTIVLGQEYSVFTAQDAQSAYRLIDSQCFDLAIFDTRLPDGTGIDLLHKMQGVSPNTPVLFASADTREVIRDEALRAGALVYLVKPIDMAALKKTIAEFIDNSERQSSQAVVEGERAFKEALRARSRTPADRIATALAHPNELKVEAQRSFLKSGGTRAAFERLWPTMIAGATDQRNVNRNSRKPLGHEQ